MRGTVRHVKRMLLISMATMAIVVSVPAANAGSGSGSIMVGQIGTVARGITETEFRNHRFCGSAPTTQGVDGLVYDLAGAANTFSVTGASSAPFSLNVIFIAPNCISTTGFFLTTTGNLQRTSISSSIPTNSRWMVVSAVYGANIAITYSTT